MWEIFEDAIIDSVKMLPVLFAAYLVIEYVEHKSSDKLVRGLKKFGIAGGAALGCLPQCGFSAAASNLYAGRIITAGTLIAVFISTSDEAIPILLSTPGNLNTIIILIAIKVLIAVIAGIMADYLFKGFFRKNTNGDISNAIHEHVCTDCGCSEESGIIKPAIKHTINIFIFILLTSLALNILLYFAGENISRILLNNNILQPALAGIIGLIPNCAASIILTQLFIEGNLSFGSVISGLSSSAGVGLIVLFKTNRNIIENIKIVTYVYIVSVSSGMIIAALF